MNIRHDIDPKIVKKNIKKQISRYKKYRKEEIKERRIHFKKYQEAKENNKHYRFGKKPASTKNIVKIYKKLIKEEKDYFSKVRIIELPKEGKRFILVYGDIKDKNVQEGTGPFSTLKEAKNWFLKYGR